MSLVVVVLVRVGYCLENHVRFVGCIIALVFCHIGFSFGHFDRALVGLAESGLLFGAHKSLDKTSTVVEHDLRPSIFRRLHVCMSRTSHYQNAQAHFNYIPP